MESQPTTRQLSDTRRETYNRALRVLTAQLSSEEYRYIDTKDFCVKYSMLPSFFTALLGLNAIERDPLGKDLKALNTFRKTKDFFQVSPDEIVTYMRSQGGKTVQAARKAKRELDREAMQQQYPDLPAAVPAELDPLPEPSDLPKVEKELEDTVSFPYTVMVYSNTIQLSANVIDAKGAKMVIDILNVINNAT